MPTSVLVAGVDSSTQATKVVVVDADSGAVVASGQGRHTVTGTGGARETDPREWWSALRAALAATGRAGDIAAIAVAGQQHGLVVLDGHGSPLRPASLWNDTRAAPDAERLTDRLGAGAWARLTGLRPVASFTVCKWAWLRRTEPEVARATAAIRLPHDYVTERLTGRGTTDRSDVSGTGWWSPATGGYLDEILSCPRSPFPSIACRRSSARPKWPGTVTSVGRRGAGTGARDEGRPGNGRQRGRGARTRPDRRAGGHEPRNFRDDLRGRGSPGGRPDGIVAGFADATADSCRSPPPSTARSRSTAWPAGSGSIATTSRRPATWSSCPTSTANGHRTCPLSSGTISRPSSHHDAAADPHGDLRGRGRLAAGGIRRDRRGRRRSRPGAPLLLIGGGSRGETWRSVVRRLTGRAVQIPEATEAVAMGAAAQAAAILRGEDPTDVASRWDVGRGMLLDPVQPTPSASLASGACSRSSSTRRPGPGSTRTV